jgi:hypothetical protein
MADTCAIRAVSGLGAVGGAKWSSAWFAKRELDYMRDHPLLTVENAARKLEVAFSCALSPSREPFVQATHGLTYCPIRVLAAAGLWISSRNWRTLASINLLFPSFAG